MKQTQAWLIRTRKFSASPLSMTQEEWVKSNFPGMSFDEILSEHNYPTYRKVREEWQDAMQRGLSMGEVSPEDAKQKKFFLETGHGAMPEVPLYHVTTARDAVIQSGIKTRKELSQGLGAGLGGGTSNTISFTTDLETAQGILSNMREARAYARGELTFDDLYQMAEQGQGAQKPWLKDWLSYHGSKKGEIPEEVQATVDGYETKDTVLPKHIEEMDEEGWEPIPESKWKFGTYDDQYTRWRRRVDPEHGANDRFQLFKTWSTFRESAGGPLDPLYFLSDPQKLAAVPDEQLAILEFKAKPRAYGHQVSSLGEWRTYTGDAVEFVKEVPYQPVTAWVVRNCKLT